MTDHTRLDALLYRLAHAPAQALVNVDDLIVELCECVGREREEADREIRVLKAQVDDAIDTLRMITVVPPRMAEEQASQCLNRLRRY